MPHIQTQTEWESEMSLKILQLIHDELYVDLRFLELALSALMPKENSAIHMFATDGNFLYYSPKQILQIFQNNSKFLCRAYLHSVFHCLYSHLWNGGNRKRELWHIACDIAVEYTIDTLDKACTNRILTLTRRQLYCKFQGKEQYISAAIIYRELLKLSKEQLYSLQMEFYTDDHSYWPKKHNQGNNIQQPTRKKWEKISRQANIKQEQLGQETANIEKLINAQLKANKNRRNYQDFLKKFTHLHEELHCNLDEFDLNYYTYGLSLYKNMPLIEPLETREAKKIREFIIVLDTSDSTSGKLIQNFLNETFQILQQQETFFRTCKIRILQCDNQVRMDQVINNLEQAEQFISQLKIIGGGGTDFRPAFAYINRLIEDGLLSKPDGLLYFTDGKGIYPKKRPSFQTAFLFLEEYDETIVPAWAMRLKLEPEEFTNQNRTFTQNRRNYEHSRSKK